MWGQATRLLHEAQGCNGWRAIDIKAGRMHLFSGAGNADTPAGGGGATLGRSPCSLSELTRQAKSSRQAFPGPGRSYTAGQSPAGRYKALLGACEAQLPVQSMLFQAVESCRVGLLGFSGWRRG